MTLTQGQRYARTGLLAIEPHAFLELFFAPATRGLQCMQGVDVIDVVGPIEQFYSPCFDSYEAIRARMQAACESQQSKAIVMRFSSPGGDVLGCFETAQALRDMAAAAQKPLYAYVEKATSAAYALASAASYIACSSVSLVGNIGVINRREDISVANAARGLRIEFITSGSRKAYGNPDLPLSPEELESTQQIVDQTAQVFFDFVSRMRGLSAEQIKGFEAGIFVGESAVSNRLADGVQSFEQLIARAASGEIGAMMGSPYEKARAALQEGAKGDDANAIACKRALAAMGGDEESEDDKPADDKKSEEKKPEAASSGGGSSAESTEEKKKDESAALAAAAAALPVDASGRDIALKALAEVHTMKVEQQNRELRAERAQLLASRPDFSPELRAILESADMDTVRKTVATLPKSHAAGQPLMASTEQVGGTRGATHGSPSPTTNLDLDAAMGIADFTMGVTRKGNAQIFGPLAKPNGGAK